MKILYQKLSRVKIWASFLSKALLQKRFQDLRLLRLAFPDCFDPPTQCLERHSIARVPFHILIEFVLPIVGSRFRHGRFGTPGMPMPETTVHENHRFPFRQHDVRFAWQILTVESKPKAHRMGRFSNANFGRRIFPCDSGHKPRAPFRRKQIDQFGLFRCFGVFQRFLRIRRFCRFRLRFWF